jgi:hypothetical protein
MLFGDRLLPSWNHQPFLEAAFPVSTRAARRAGGSRSRTIRPYCAGPQWGNSKSSIEHLVPLYQRSGVRIVLSGH